MNIFLWILQAILALHTIMGAVWKFSNTEQAAGTLKAIPHGVWLGLSVIELLCAVGLIIPALNKSMSGLAPIAAVVIAAEMLLFCAVNLSSGAPDSGQMIYWLVVAAICVFIAFGRFKLSPL